MWKKTNWVLVVATAVAVCATVAVGVVLWQAPAEPSAEDLFLEYVVDPIPASVSEIRADCAKRTHGLGYVLAFMISREDLAPILDSGPFRPIPNVEYFSGHLRWERSERHWESMHLYEVPGLIGHTKKPAWFTPESWDNCEAYISTGDHGKAGIKRILLYSAELGEAYFIAFTYH